MPDAAPLARAASFQERLKAALEAFHQPEVLGRTSPLAAPYFLGAAVHGADLSPAGRGKALCAQIQSCLETMWGGPLPSDGRAMLQAAEADSDLGGRYDCLVLELNYLKQRYRPAPRNQADIYHDILHISRPTHDRHLRRAVNHLGTVLLQWLHPAVRAEQPIMPARLIGRDQVHAQALADLTAGKAVSLTGPGGVGKTSLGAALTDAWNSPAVFWYTFRPTLNDHLDSLLFALGHFLHTQGASTLWHQLVADGGRIADRALARGLAVHDLGTLRQRPLLCFDELDFLRPPTQDLPRAHHVQLLEFLDSLRGHTAMLWIGQRAFWESDALYALVGLSEAELAALLDGYGLPYRADELAHLYRYTAGNPRLAELCLALYQTAAGASLSDVLTQLPQSQALLPLWHRLERRLPAAERALVYALAVFRSPAPADVWLLAAGEPADALTQLIQRRLVQQDERGGVALLPALREVVYGAMDVDLKLLHHAQAAAIRAERGEITAAAYHLTQADQPDAAVELWYAHRSDEINRGQAGAALAIFSQVAQRRLSPARRKELLLLRAELHELTGAPDRVIDELGQAAWPAEDPATPEAMLRLGQAFDIQGRPQDALDTYQAGLDAVARLLHQGAQLHVQRSMTQLRQRDMQQAWREANLAQFHAETMLGALCDQRGDYDQAHSHYARALTIAQDSSYLAGIARTHHYLAILTSRRQELERALQHFDQAITFYEQIGDRVNREYVRGNLASAYIQSRRFAEALAPAELALRFFQAMGNPFRTAQNASNLAEAHAELGNLDQAQHYAEIVLQQEEPHSHPYALYTLGTVARQRGDWVQAEQHYAHSRRMAEMNTDSYLLAFAWRALGEVYQAQQRRDDALAALTQAHDLFTRLGVADEARQTADLRDQVAAAA